VLPPAGGSGSAEGSGAPSAGASGASLPARRRRRPISRMSDPGQWKRAAGDSALENDAPSTGPGDDSSSKQNDDAADRSAGASAGGNPSTGETSSDSLGDDDSPGDKPAAASPATKLPAGAGGAGAPSINGGASSGITAISARRPVPTSDELQINAPWNLPSTEAREQAKLRVQSSQSSGLSQTQSLTTSRTGTQPSTSAA